MTRIPLLLLTLTLLTTLEAQSVRSPTPIPDELEETAWGLSVREVATGLTVVDVRGDLLLATFTAD